MKNCVIYTRVSSDRQEKEGFSIPAQIEFLNEYAKKKLYNVTKTFSESETAKQSGRKAFNEMLAYIKEKNINTILVEKTDRLYRNLKDYVTLEDYDLEIHLVKEGTILTKNSNSNEKLMHGIKVLMAKNYIDNLSEEVKKGLAQKARQGHYPHRAPVGYKNIKAETGKGIIAIDTDKAPFVMRLFELYALGTSVEQCQKILTEEGLNNKGKPYAKSRFLEMLHNPFYIGNFIYKGVLYPGKHEPIISVELYNKVQGMFTQTKVRTHEVQFDYAGLIKCGHCGCQLTAELKKGKYIYYHCTGKRGGDCKKDYIRQEEIEKVFVQLMERIDIPKEINDEIRKALKEMQYAKTDFENTSTDSITKQIKTLTGRIDNLYSDKLDGKITEEFWQEKNNQWHREKDQLINKLNSLNNASQTFYECSDLLLNWIEEVPQQFVNRPAEIKRKILNLVCQNLSYKDKKLSVVPNPVFDLIIKTDFSSVSKKQG